MTASPAGHGASQYAQSVVALGGGHGLYATLSALSRLVDDLTLDEITAVVTVADNGGSSGRLRGEFGVLPPGDLRMALAALCGDDEWGRTWADVLQHRFAGAGEMNGHVVGNLLIVSLWERLGDHVEALDWVGRLLGARGRVLPMATTPMDITARVRDVGAGPDGPVRTVRGQVEVATVDGEIVSVALDPPEPEACPEAVEAILAADWVVLGPGSWFTSVITHLMVPGLREALERTTARLVVVLNLEPQAGETGGFAAEDHLAALLEHAPGLAVDAVVAHGAGVGGPDDVAALEKAVTAAGGRLVLADVATDDGEARHDPTRLAAVLGEVFGA
ncbi:uridine diphosphate-N-acetylglucosamine-binding protein YvcK [uncultured Nocardioides sp.]|uniref:gluconeogenesis factor YvcK family protein n=1 Tax=uncultured Nocardioides sp. TaxID=198441 RepID=UPI002618CFA3|nr:uridine diphosphate-N-acetylglucosamine-binding protein YvcK [uncultured Nocardioides sp.]